MHLTCKIAAAAAFVLVCSRSALQTTASPLPFHSDGHDLGGGDDEDPHRWHSYHFQYAVHDPLTGDVKDQNEVGDGRGGVRGTYSLMEADGTKRVVEYTADDAHGFRAEVKRIAAPVAGLDGATAAGHGYPHRSTADGAADPAPVSEEDVGHEPFAR